MRNIFLILSFVCLSFLAKGQDTLLGPHGGIIVPGGKYHVEVFRCGEYYEIFLLTKELKSVSNYSIEGDLKYFYLKSTQCRFCLLPIKLRCFGRIPHPEV